MRFRLQVNLTSLFALAILAVGTAVRAEPVAGFWTASPDWGVILKSRRAYALNLHSGIATPIGEASRCAVDATGRIALVTRGNNGIGATLSLGRLVDGRFLTDARGETGLSPQSVTPTHRPDRPFCLVGVSPTGGPANQPEWRAREVWVRDGHVEFGPVDGFSGVVTIVGAAGPLYAAGQPGTFIYNGLVEDPKALDGTMLKSATGDVLALVSGGKIRHVWPLQGTSSMAFPAFSRDGFRLFGWFVIQGDNGNPFKVIDVATGQATPCDFVDQSAEIVAVSPDLDSMVAQVKKEAGDVAEPGQIVYDGPVGRSVQLLRKGQKPQRLMGLDESQQMAGHFDADRILLTDGTSLWTWERGQLKKIDLKFERP